MSEATGSGASKDASTRSVCLAAVRDLEQATVTDIASRSGLSRPTVTAALTWLAARGLVDEAEQLVQPQGGGGRPARLTRFRPEGGVVAGVDVVGPCVEVVVTDLSGRQVAASTAEHASPRTQDPDPALVRDALHAVLADAGVDPSLLRAVGVGMAGLVQRDGVALTSPLVASWAGRDVRADLHRVLGVPVVVDNDLSLSALAESRLGATAHAPVGAFIQTWHHVSARVTIDGAVLRGRRNSAGEVGLLRSFTDIDVPDGGLGVALPPVDADLQRLHDEPDDPAGAAALERLVAAMTPAVTALVLTVDPDVVVLGGTLGRHAGLVAPLLAARVEDFTHGGPELAVRIVGSELGSCATAVGAVHQAFETFSAQVYGVAGVTPPVPCRPPATPEPRSDERSRV